MNVLLENKYGIFEKVDKLYAWKKLLRVGINNTAGKRVCSLHFRDEDYLVG